MFVESVIINKTKAGSREALAVLWQEYSQKILNLAFRMMKDRDQAEDILMDVFVQIPRAIQNFRADSALGTWLYKLTVNACLMKFRAQKRHRELEDEHLDDITESAMGLSISNPNEIRSAYDPQLLEMGLAKLGVQTRSILWLKDAEGLDIKDLSEIFQMPEGTIKARLSRARHFVKNFMNDAETKTAKELEYA